MIRTRNRCDQCDGPARPDFRLCWRCHLDGERRAEYRRGFDDGVLFGRALGEKLTVERLHAERNTARLPLGAIFIDSATWRRLALLAHPDRHGGSPASVTAMTWLNQIRGQIAQ